MEELISRQAAIDALGEEPLISNNHDDYELGRKNQWEYDIEALKALPPVQQKYGRWIEIKNKKGTVIAIKCDKCSQFPKHGVRSDFCPNCGADMRGEQYE